MHLNKSMKQKSLANAALCILVTTTITGPTQPDWTPLRQCHELRVRRFSDRNFKSFGGIFQHCAVVKFKMTPRSGGGQRGKRNNSGRKRISSDVKGAKEWKRCHKHMYLDSNIFKVQNRACAAHETVPFTRAAYRGGSGGMLPREKFRF